MMKVSVKSRMDVIVSMLFMAATMLQPAPSFGQEEEPAYLRDRGPGIPMSIFGTYIRKGEVLLYPFYEYYHDADAEYKPSDFGFPSEEDFRGRFKAHEGIFFFGYGISENFAFEVEAGVIDAQLERAKEDNKSGMPAQLKESGLSDVEGQLRWRWNRESAKTPEYFSYVLAVLPTGKENSLIGTSNWQLKYGAGLIKGFKWGTITPSLAVEYDAGEKVYDFAYGFEYLKKLSSRARFFAMIEGTQDEAALITELQLYFSRSVFLKVNNGFGLTSKAVDFAPEIGIMFSTK